MPATSGTSNYLTNILFMDYNTGFVTGYSGLVLETTNSGDSRFSLSVPISSDLFNITLSLSQEIFVYGTCSAVLYSNDNGSFWIQRNTMTANNLTGIKFLNNITGFSSGQNGTIIKTTDKGSTRIVLNTGTNV